MPLGEWERLLFSLITLLMVFNVPIIREFARFYVPILGMNTSFLHPGATIHQSAQVSALKKFLFSMHSWSNIFVIFIRYKLKYLG